MSAVERSAIRWGTRTIEYAIRRSGRRRTVSIAIDPADGLLLIAPIETPIARLDGVVRAKASWVLRRLSERPSSSSSTARELVSGESFRYLGRGYRLRVIASARASTRLRGGWLESAVPDCFDALRVRRTIVDWYRARASERLPAIVREWAVRVRVPVRDVLVREQRRRWASCDSGGVIRVNWRIIQAERSLIDYVAAHEVVHLLHREHSPTFWTALERVMPDFERRRRALRARGPMLEW